MFAFYKKYWDLLKVDIIEFVKEFFVIGKIPSGCNSSFITLIPKVNCLVVVRDFRHISLIGAQYKINANVIALCLAKRISYVVTREQSAFMKGRQILDGPLMVNKIVDWCKKKKDF